MYKINQWIIGSLLLALGVLASCEDPTNLPVKADFEYSPKDSILTTDTFKLVNKSTPKSRIVEYRWDINGDGVVDSQEENPMFFFTEAGRYTIVLTVRGNKGDIALKSTAVNVRRPVNGKLMVYRRAKMNGEVLVEIEGDTLKRKDSLFFATPPLCTNTKPLNYTLKEGNYKVKATYTKTGDSWTKEIFIWGGTCNVVEYNIPVNTRLELVVNDTANKPTSAAAVQLFASYRDWQNRQNAVTTVQNTSTDGKITFQNLNPVRYWVRATKGILAADSTSIPPLTEGILNSGSVQLKK